MAKKIEKKEEAEEVTFNDSAVSIVKTGEKKYSVVIVKFNLETNEVGEIITKHSGLDLFDAQYYFKLVSVDLGLF